MTYTAKFRTKNIEIDSILISLVDSGQYNGSKFTLDVTDYKILDGVWHLQFSNEADMVKFAQMIDGINLMPV